MSLKDVCRACLGIGRTMFPVLESIEPKFDSSPKPVQDLWKIFDNILIDSEGKFHRKICVECIEKIHQTYSFVMACKLSGEIMSRMKNARINLKNLKIITDLSDIPKNIETENDISPYIIQIKTEKIDTDEENDEESSDNLADPDYSDDEVSIKQDIKEEQELDISMEEDELESEDKFDYEDKSVAVIFKCPDCRFKCRVRKRLEKHLIENHMDEQMCKLCNKEFEGQPIEHCSVHIHAEKAITVHKTANKEYHTCNICSKIFSKRKGLRRHLLNHTGKRPFKCEFCMKKFRIKSQLTIHLRWHTAERPFKCEICTKGFRRKTQLTSHLIFHTGEQPFKCEICSKRFQLKFHLSIHSKMHTIKCKNCERTFQRKIDLALHLPCGPNYGTCVPL